MFVHLSAIILLYTASINAHYVVSSDMKKELPNATYTFDYPGNCDPGQTECGEGCCPFPDGVCCVGNQCCPKGQVCIPIAGICMTIDTETENGKPVLVSTNATTLIEICPRGTTTCGKDRCCMFPDATCCSDGLHCCPSGFSCDLQQLKCVKRIKLYTVLDASDKMVATKSASKKTTKSCPGGSQKCPVDTSCCLNDNGFWGCCPKPSIHSEKNVQDTMDCCYTYYGFTCCVDICAYWGCI